MFEFRVGDEVKVVSGPCLGFAGVVASASGGVVTVKPASGDTLMVSAAVAELVRRHRYEVGDFVRLEFSWGS